jgi:glutathione S-transferase
MILIGQYDSSFVRRCAIAMRRHSMAFEHRPWSTFCEAHLVTARLIALRPSCQLQTLRRTGH